MAVNTQAITTGAQAITTGAQAVAAGSKAAAKALDKADDRVAYVTRAVHDWGLASWLGGAMFGKFALNPAVRTIESKPDRGRVANSAWGAYNVINALSLSAVSLSWAAARASEARPDRLGPAERRFARAKDVFAVGSVVSGVVSGVQGARLARQSPEGAVPIESGTEPAPETPPSAASIQRTLDAAGTASIVSGVGLVISNALLAQAGHSRPPLRRGLLRRTA